MPPMRLKPATSQSQVKHSTNEPPHSSKCSDVFKYHKNYTRLLCIIRTISFHEDGGGGGVGGHLLEVTSARKVIKISHSCNFLQTLIILKKALV